MHTYKFFSNLLKLTFITLAIAMLIFFLQVSEALAITTPRLQVNLQEMRMSIDQTCYACKLVINNDEVASGNISPDETFSINPGDQIELQQVISLKLTHIDGRSITRSFLPLIARP